MSNKKKLIQKEVIEKDYESSSSDDQIELPKKEIKKKPFVMTEKRKESVAKMLAARKEKVNARKEIKQLEEEKIKKLKDDLKKKQEKKINKLKKEVETISDVESEEEEQIIIKKAKKKKPKKKIIVISESESESESEQEQIVKKKSKKKEPINVTINNQYPQNASKKIAHGMFV